MPLHVPEDTSSPPSTKVVLKTAVAYTWKEKEFWLVWFLSLHFDMQRPKFLPGLKTQSRMKGITVGGWFAHVRLWALGLGQLLGS